MKKKNTGRRWKPYPIPPSFTNRMEKKRRKKDKLQQKFEAQGLQNCRSRNVDLNFGTQGTNQPKENNREKKTKENFVHLYAS